MRSRLAPLFIVIGVVCFSLATFPGCRHAREAEGMQAGGTLRGTVYVIGNEPFTALALQDSLGRMHRVHGPKKLEDLLFQRQGKVVTVTIVGTTQSPDGPVTEIDRAGFPDLPPDVPIDSTTH